VDCATVYDNKKLETESSVHLFSPFKDTATPQPLINELNGECQSGYYCMYCRGKESLCAGRPSHAFANIQHLTKSTRQQHHQANRTYLSEPGNDRDKEDHILGARDGGHDKSESSSFSYYRTQSVTAIGTRSSDQATNNGRRHPFSAPTTHPLWLDALPCIGIDCEVSTGLERSLLLQ